MTWPMLPLLLQVVIDTESLWVGGGRDPGLLMALGKLLEVRACVCTLTTAVY